VPRTLKRFLSPIEYLSLTPYSVISLFILRDFCCKFAGFRAIC
jgi:hypothetical protein